MPRLGTYNRESCPRIFNGEEIPNTWVMNWGLMAQAEIAAGTIVGHAPSIREDKQDPSQVIVWDGSTCNGMTKERYNKQKYLDKKGKR